jgi:hypothetical protein
MNGNQPSLHRLLISIVCLRISSTDCTKGDRRHPRMTPYDSDSSGGENDEYTETNVLLGYASKEPLDDTISQLGGRPVSPEA